jgi:hypothetical protein
MVIVMTTVWFPHAKAAKTGEIFIEVSKKFPEDKSLSKGLLNNAVATTKEGYKVVSADEIKEGKLVQYLARLNKILIFVANEIEGYKYKIELYSTIIEAMGVLGLKPPE